MKIGYDNFVRRKGCDPLQTAALIVAAGMSSRMGVFKPMLNIGSISIAQRVIATLQQAGVDRIVMITGYNAIQLERHLSGLESFFSGMMTMNRPRCSIPFGSASLI